MEFIILDFGSAEKLAAKQTLGASRAVETETVMMKVALDMMRVEEEIFESQGRRGGGSWKPLAGSTVYQKGHSTILEDSNALRDSLTISGAPYQILKILNSTIEFGTERPYAYLHQTGQYPHVPRRPFLRFLPTDLDRWSGMLYNHLMAPFRASQGVTKV